MVKCQEVEESVVGTRVEVSEGFGGPGIHSKGHKEYQKNDPLPHTNT